MKDEKARDVTASPGHSHWWYREGMSERTANGLCQREGGFSERVSRANRLLETKHRNRIMADTKENRRRYVGDVSRFTIQYYDDADPVRVAQVKAELEVLGVRDLRDTVGKARAFVAGLPPERRERFSPNEWTKWVRRLASDVQSHDPR